MDNPFFQKKENECYYFSYSNINPDLLSSLVNRPKESILYQNCLLFNFARIFCDNGDGTSVASIHQEYDAKTYGIVYKITFEELDILESYHSNYTLNRIRINYTSVNVNTSQIIKVDNKILLTYRDDEWLIPYVFIHKNHLNNNRIKPTNEYVQQIRSMLDSRRLIENCSYKKIMLLCVTNEFKPEDKYHDNYYYFNEEYPNPDEKTLIFYIKIEFYNYVYLI